MSVDALGNYLMTEAEIAAVQEGKTCLFYNQPRVSKTWSRPKDPEAGPRRFGGRGRSLRRQGGSVLT